MTWCDEKFEKTKFAQKTNISSVNDIITLRYLEVFSSLSLNCTNKILDWNTWLSFKDWSERTCYNNVHNSLSLRQIVERDAWERYLREMLEREMLERDVWETLSSANDESIANELLSKGLEIEIIYSCYQVNNSTS